MSTTLSDVAPSIPMSNTEVVPAAVVTDPLPPSVSTLEDALSPGAKTPPARVTALSMVAEVTPVPSCRICRVSLPSEKVTGTSSGVVVKSPARTTAASSSATLIALAPPDDLREFTIGLYRECEIFDRYRGWRVVQRESYILEDEHPGGVRHRHPIDKLVAQRSDT